MEPQEPHYSLAVGHRKRHKAFTLIRPLASLTKGDGNVANEPLVRSSGKEPDAFQKLAKAFSRMDEQDRKLLVRMAEGMARRGTKRPRSDAREFQREETDF
jgi:hypothetical protein